MKSTGPTIWRSPLWTAGYSLMASMAVVMMAESFSTSRPTPGPVKVVVGGLEFVGIGLAMFAVFRFRQQHRPQP